MSTEEPKKEETQAEPGGGQQPASQANLPVPRKEALPPMAGNREWHCFDGTPKNIWRLKALCQTASSGAASVAGKTFAVKYYYVHEVQIYEQQGGEYVSAYRVCLVGPNMEIVSFVSQGILTGLASMIEAMGRGPYDPPMEVLVTQVKTRAGHTYNIVPAE